MLQVLTTAACASFTDCMSSGCWTPPIEGGIVVFLLRQYVTQKQGDNYASTYSKIVTNRRVTRRCRCLELSALMWAVMPFGLLQGILAGDLWFPHSAVLLRSLNGMAIWYLWFCGLFPLCFLLCQWWYNAIISLPSLVSSSLLYLRFLLAFFGRFILFVCFGFLFRICCLVFGGFSFLVAVFLLWDCDCSDHVQTPTSSLFPLAVPNLLIICLFATCYWTCLLSPLNRFGWVG